MLAARNFGSDAILKENPGLSFKENPAAAPGKRGQTAPRSFGTNLTNQAIGQSGAGKGAAVKKLLATTVQVAPTLHEKTVAPKTRRSKTLMTGIPIRPEDTEAVAPVTAIPPFQLPAEHDWKLAEAQRSLYEPFITDLSMDDPEPLSYGNLNELPEEVLPCEDD
jgi:hypothetical protein